MNNEQFKQQKFSLGTLAVTGGFHHDETTGATNAPIYLSNAYQFKSADSAANLFDLTEPGYIYTRIHNPTTEILEARLAALEGGTAAVATSSGQFAEMLTICTLCKSGDEIVASSKLYGGTLNLLAISLQRFGIVVKFVEQDNLNEWENAVTDRTKGFYFETLANPDSSIPDFEGISKIAQKHKVPVIIDSTMTTPYLIDLKPYADIVIHSTTKYFCGNGTALGGALIDMGRFDWASGRFPDFTEPDKSYHGIKFAETFGNAVFAVRARVTLLRDFGGTSSPFNSFLTVAGLQTLHLRMPRHVENARALAAFLKGHPLVESVGYPELPEHPDNAKSKKYFPKGAGGLLNFKIKGGYENAKKFIENLKLCVHAVNVGDSRTIITHPASTTHRQSEESDLMKAGITKNFIRVSAGIEDVVDIIADLNQALKFEA